MKFTVTATQPLPDETAARQADPAHPGEWLEAEEAAESLDDALAMVRQWSEDGTVTPYGHGPVTFHIQTTP